MGLCCDCVCVRMVFFVVFIDKFSLVACTLLDTERGLLFLGGKPAVKASNSWLAVVNLMRVI